MDLARLFIIAVLIAIIASLGSALVQLSRGGGDSQKMLRALTWRIGLSVALFLLLLLAWQMGYIRPHNLQNGQIQ
jgi:cytochrome b561